MSKSAKKCAFWSKCRQDFNLPVRVDQNLLGNLTQFFPVLVVDFQLGICSRDRFKLFVATDLLRKFSHKNDQC